jgi:hypothetical protein
MNSNDGFGCIIALIFFVTTGALLYGVASWFQGSADPATLIAALYATWAVAPIVVGGIVTGISFVVVMFTLGALYFRDWLDRPNWNNPQ